MIIPSQIISHIQRNIWRFTDAFSVELTVNSQSVIDARTIQIVTDSAHGLAAGKSIICKNGLIENAITAVDAVGDNLEFTTAYIHDLTNTDGPLDEVNLLLSGFTDSSLNDSFNIQTITAENKFQIINPLAGLPTLTGSELLLENRPLGVTGLFEIVSVIDAVTFNVEIPDYFPDIPLTGVREIEVVKGFRVAGVESPERADQIYTEQNASDMWLFLVMGDTEASKDRHTLSDAVMDSTYQDDMRQKFLQNFDTHVYIPTSTELSGIKAQELAYGEIFNSILYTMFGTLFEDENSRQNLLTVSQGHGPGLYNTAYYTHIYSWQQPTQITFDVGIQGKVFEDVAFRELNGALKPFDPENPDGFEFTIKYL